MVDKNLLTAFFVGFTASLFTAIYLSRGYHKAEHENSSPLLHFEYMFPVIAVSLGVANVLNVYLKEQYKWLIGVAVGLIFSTFGIYIGIHEKYFGLTKTKARFVAMFYYAVLFGVFVAASNKKLELVK
jgi:hypothetical protein